MNNERYRYYCLVIGWCVILVLAIMCFGCTTTKYVPVTTVRTDTVQVNRWRTDSVIVRDSIVIDHKGDTVYIDRWRWRDRTTTKVDTVYRSRTDSVAVPAKVEAQLTKWQKAKQDIGGIAIGAVIALFFAVGLWWWKKK
jgi:hypothetical protein